MTCSTKPLLIHLLRGLLGIVLVIAAFRVAASLPAAALLLGAGALFAFRGCPTCWVVGLLEHLPKAGKAASLSQTGAQHPVTTGQSSPVSTRFHEPARSQRKTQ